MSEAVVAIDFIASYASNHWDYTRNHSKISVAGSEFASRSSGREIPGLKQLSQPNSTPVLNLNNDTLRTLSYLVC